MNKLYTIIIKFKCYKLIINNIINHYYIINIRIYFYWEAFKQSKTLKELEAAEIY